MSYINYKPIKLEKQSTTLFRDNKEVRTQGKPLLPILERKINKWIQRIPIYHSRNTGTETPAETSASIGKPQLTNC